MLALASALASFVFALPAAVQAPQFELQLVRADAGPVAGAQVRWFEGEAPRDDLGAFEAAALASGKLALADERGRVVIEGARERVNIAASLPGWWGYMYFDGAGSVVIDEKSKRLEIAGMPRDSGVAYVQRYAWLRDPSGRAAQHREDSSSLSIVLHADRELDFHVVDREGIGVPGVPVLLWSPMNPGVRSLRAVSGVNGRGAFRHASAWWAAESEPSRLVEAFGGADEEGERETNTPRITLPFVVLAGDWPTLEVESLPHSSRRRIELGKELPSEPVVVSASDLKEVVLSVRTTADVAPLDGGWVTDPDDWTRFPLVAPVGGIAGVSQARLWVHADSAPIALYARRNSSSAEYPFSIWRPAVLAGRAEAVVGRDHRTLRVRPLIDGSVRPHTEFRLVHSDQGSGWHSFAAGASTVSSDANGDILFDVRSARDLKSFAVVHTSATTGDRVGVVQGTPPIDGALELLLLPRNQIELTVVDDLGVPLPRARTQVSINRATVDGLPHCAVGMPIRSVPEDLGHELEARTGLVVSRSDGNYLEGPWSGLLSVSVDGHASAEVEFDANTKSATLVLPRLATILGYVRTADPYNVAGLNLLLLRRESHVPEAESPGVSLGCSCDGRFEFEALRPAEYTLIVRRVVSGARPVEITRRNKLVLMPGEVLDLGEIVID